MKRVLTAVPLMLVAIAFPVILRAQIDSDLLAGMKARSIGPAAMSGRIAAIDVVESNPDVMYVGAATGGVWKSIDGGVKWTPIFDDQPVAAIGAIAVFQPNPDVVWVGTGEGNVRNSASVGNGIYRSVDGGTTWTHVGLEATERISRIVLDPRNANVAWVAAMGREWGENPERGVFRTTDGGKSWSKVLYVDERTGAADLIADPGNPDKLFVSMWDYRRWPWFFRSGGPGSGVYVTWDGGTTWKRFSEADGMPKGILGRAGLAIARSNPQIVYALVEAEKSALLRSENGGTSWKAVNQDPDVAPRPFYFCEIRVDPSDPNRVYSLYTGVKVSDDGGKTFRTLIDYSHVHPDHHAYWIDPADARFMIDGNDGGVSISRDRGQTWRFVSNLPVAQYYHVAVDMMTPYNIYGGMQDNGSWRGPSAVWETGGIRNFHWQEVGFGDGFGTAPSSITTTGYSMSQEGYIRRWDVVTGEQKDIRPPDEKGTKLRFNWNAAMSTDPFDPNTVYFGSQFLHKSTDRGETWKTISPDLTTNNPQWQQQAKSGGLTLDATGAENFTTIVTIAPSPVSRDVVWVGTDDGRIQVTRNGGSSWSSVEASVKGVPANTWVPEIKASKYDAGTAFAVFDDHRRSNWTPYVYRTTDYGKSWTSLVTRDLRGYALSIEQDPVDPDLLFLGTEFGLWFTQDGGKSWTRWTAGFPTVSVMSLVVHPREHDLVVGTHGRSAYVIDDIRPLRTVSKQILSEPIHLFQIPDAQQYRKKRTPGARFAGDTAFDGTNRPYGAIITYSLNAADLPNPSRERERERKEKERSVSAKALPITPAGIPQEALDVPKPGEERVAAVEQKIEEPKEPAEKGPKAEITVTDSTGKKIRTFKADAALGVNRAVWDLRRDAFRTPPQEEAEQAWNQGGPEVVPGVYSITVKYGDRTATGNVRVIADPRFSVADGDRQAKAALIDRTGALEETVTDAVRRIQKTRQELDSVIARTKPATGPLPTAETPESPLSKSAKALQQKLDALEKKLWNPPKQKGIVAETDPKSKIDYVLSSLQSSWDAPTPAQLAYFEQAREELGKALQEVNRFYAEDVQRFAEEIGKADLKLLSGGEPMKVPE